MHNNKLVTTGSVLCPILDIVVIFYYFRTNLGLVMYGALLRLISYLKKYKTCLDNDNDNDNYKLMILQKLISSKID